MMALEDHLEATLVDQEFSTMDLVVKEVLVDLEGLVDQEILVDLETLVDLEILVDLETLEDLEALEDLVVQEVLVKLEDWVHVAGTTMMTMGHLNVEDSKLQNASNTPPLYKEECLHFFIK